MASMLSMPQAQMRSALPRDHNDALHQHRPLMGGHISDYIDKPLSQMSDTELGELANDLRDMHFIERERFIEEGVRRYVEHWERMRQSACALPQYAPSVFQLHFQDPESMSVGRLDPYSPMTTSVVRHITVSVPGWMPPEYVPALADRMLREQVGAVGQDPPENDEGPEE